MCVKVDECIDEDIVIRADEKAGKSLDESQKSQNANKTEGDKSEQIEEGEEEKRVDIIEEEDIEAEEPKTPEKRSVSLESDK